MSNASEFFGGGGATIKSIQRGVISIANGGYNGSATVTAVNTAKAQLRFLGVSGSTNTLGATYHNMCNVVLTNATTVTAASAGASQGTSFVSWELTEWN